MCKADTRRLRKPGHTLISPSGTASENLLASRAISASSRIGELPTGALFLDLAGSPVDDKASLGVGACGGDEKNRLKIHSACHLVALVKLTQTSIRPGLVSTGSIRSMQLVVAKRSLWEMRNVIRRDHGSQGDKDALRFRSSSPIQDA